MLTNLGANQNFIKMKRAYKMTFVALFLAVCIVNLSSCGKKKLEKATVSAEDNSEAESLFNDLFNQSSAANADADKIGRASCRERG